MLKLLAYAVGISSTFSVICWIFWLLFIIINGDRTGISDLFAGGGLVTFVCSIGSLILWAIWKCVLGG